MVDFAFVDSGTGGIPYLLELKHKSPESECVYIGDTANFPYGQKSHEEIVFCISRVISKIIEKFSPPVIVIACNTISVNALEALRKQFPDTEFVGTVPAIKLAAKISKNKRIGLLATKATCENPYNIDLKNKFASDCELVMRPDPELISFIEHKSFSANKEEKIAACKDMADFFKKNDCDAVILGCTHFLNMKDEIQEACGKGISVVDSCDGVVNHAMEVFAKRKDPQGMLRQTQQPSENYADCMRFGVLGAEPLGEGVAEKTATERGLCSQGKAFPTKKSALYVTGFSDKDDENEYNALCSRFGLEFCGVLN